MRITRKTVTDSDASTRPMSWRPSSIGRIFSHAMNPRRTAMNRIESWSEFYRERPTIADAVNQVSAHLPLIEQLLRCERILEIGVGTGSLSGFLGSFVATTVLESDEKVARNASQNPLFRNSRVRLVVGDGMRIPFKDSSFDAMYSQGLWEHFPDAEIHRFVREGLRVARVVLASVPTKWYPHLGKMWRPALRGDERLLGKEAWQRVLARGGYTAEATYYPDFKLATIGGWTLPWPTHLLVRISRPR